MATAQATANSVVDKAATPTAVAKPESEEFVYVTVPERTVLGWTHPGIGINLQHYGPGTHKVSADLGREINERLRAHHLSQLQLLEPRVSELVHKKLYDMV